MASIKQDPTSGVFRVQFWIGDRHFTKSLKTTEPKTADSMMRIIEETLYDIDRGKVVVPEDADLWEFIKTGGKRGQAFRAPKRFTVKELFAWYFEQQAPGGKEDNTLSTEHTHEKHFFRILGANSALVQINGDALQDYVNTRAKEKWHGELIAPETIRKELSTLQLAWNRAVRKKVYIGDSCPTADLQMPKSKEKPHFQTWGEIENAIAAQPSMGEAERKQLWDSLFLRRSEIEELLAFCRDKKTRSIFFYPMMVFGAHTGARQSEMLRSRQVDFKFRTGEVVIREKKKNKNTETLRRVPMSKLLHTVMEDYFKQCPDSLFTISRDGLALTPHTAQKAHESFFRSNKWRVLRGYHVLRHSFASNLACEGISQAVIDELMGHQTETMRRRYRHFFPEQRHEAVRKLFG